MSERDIQALYMSAERRWLDRWVAGPTLDASPRRRGDAAPDVEVLTESGDAVALSVAWEEKPALILLWRHLGCGCGQARVERLNEEMEAYVEAGLNVVAVAPGDPERVAAYRDRYQLQATMLADPDFTAHRAFGLGHWAVEQVLYDAPEEFCAHTEGAGRSFQADRRSQGRPLVDDPWMQSAEFVVGRDGMIRIAYLYNYCEDYPDPRVFTTAARLAG